MVKKYKKLPDGKIEVSEEKVIEIRLAADVQRERDSMAAKIEEYKKRLKELDEMLKP